METFNKIAIDRKTSKKGFDVEINFTTAFIKYHEAHPAIREAHCLKAMFPAALSPIQENDLLAGRFISTPGVNSSFKGWNANTHNIPALGFLSLPPACGPGSGYFCNEDTFRKKISDLHPDAETCIELEQIIQYWKTETIFYKTRAAYPEAMNKAMPFDDLAGLEVANSAYPLVRMTGPHFDYDKLMQLGIPGLSKLIKEHQEKKESELYDGLLMATELLADVCKYYSHQAFQLAADTTGKRKKELEEMADVLFALTLRAPETLYEAMQLTLIYGVLATAFSWGRMDEYLGDFYANDIDSGKISEGKALLLAQNLWTIISDNGAPYDNRVVIGGKGRRNPQNADRFAHLAIKATRTVLENLPQLSLRFYQGQDPSIYEHALLSISEGRTFPMLYNDDVNIPAVQNAMRISYQEAEQYVPYGCGEYVIYKKSVHTPSGVINNAKVLECLLRNGTEPATKRISGPQFGNLKDFKNWEDFFDAYKKSVEYWVRLTAEQQKIEYDVVGKETAHLFWSLLYEDCIGRNKAVFSGGLHHLGGTLESYGQINAADSLLAIKKLVFEQKLIDPDRLIAALDADFKGFEKERQLMLKVPKYGNDNAEADQMAIMVHEHLCNYTREQASRVGLDSYLIVIINNLMNTVLGAHTFATPDGRKALEPFANANNPSHGSDKNGVTAFLNSILKLDPSIHDGAVQNMKFSKDLVCKRTDAFHDLLKTYFSTGGSQAMITVINKDDLEAALREPVKYKNLFVRVGGFSARFIDLDKDVQREVINRTIY